MILKIGFIVIIMKAFARFFVENMIRSGIENWMRTQSSWWSWTFWGKFRCSRILTPCLRSGVLSTAFHGKIFKQSFPRTLQMQFYIDIFPFACGSTLHRSDRHMHRPPLRLEAVIYLMSQVYILKKKFSFVTGCTPRIRDQNCEALESDTLDGHCDLRPAARHWL